MNTPSVSKLQKFVTAMKRLKSKFVTSETLSREVGLYPESINETLSFFDPLVMMDFTYDLRGLLPVIEKYIEEEESKKTPKPIAERVTKKKLLKYESISEFIYEKMTTGGFLDKNTILTDVDLRSLKRLVSDEQAKRKAVKRKK